MRGRGKLTATCGISTSSLVILAALCLMAPQISMAQTNNPEAETGTATQHHAKPPVESELIYEGEGCFGHFHIFTQTWWSDFYSGGIEYDRNSWGHFIGARKDYVAEILPVAILTQPAKTDIWGDPQSTNRETLAGLAISPVGLRMMWRYNKHYKPYFISKGGVIAFDKKALSQDATYQNFLLQIGIGVQAKLTRRLDLRVGGGYLHFSNAFMAPSNPGIDVMTYNGGLSYHFGK
ncbi:MAG: acyloxyacyl hydrolase [Terracidiphilus sp.]